jgi:hypothetical protein
MSKANTIKVSISVILGIIIVIFLFYFFIFKNLSSDSIRMYSQMSISSVDLLIRNSPLEIYFLKTSPNVEFDATKHLRITISDANTGKGVENVPIYFINNCYENSPWGGSCNGKYETVPNGKTDKDGQYIVIKKEDTPPLGVLNFQLGKVAGYNTDVGTGSFLAQGSVIPDVTIKIIPTKSNSKGSINSAKSAISAAEKDIRVKEWKAKMDKTYPNADVRSQFWRVYYQGVKDKYGNYWIHMYVDPISGLVIIFKEESSLRDKPVLIPNPWPDKPYAKGKILIVFSDSYEYQKAEKDLLKYDISLKGTNKSWSGQEPPYNYLQSSDVFAVSVPEGKEIEMAEKLYKEVLNITSTSVCPILYCY